MRPLLFLVACLLFAGLPVAAQDSLDELANSPEMAFAEDASQPFLVWNVSGGFRMAPPADFKPTPLVTLWPDGRIRTGSDRPEVKPCDGKLTREELFQLLQFIVVQNRFYEAETDEIKSAIEQAGNGPRIADAMTSRFSLNLKRGRHNVEVYALSFQLSQYPQLEGLQRLSAIEMRLRNVVALVHLGDRAAVEAMLVEVNRELKKKHPEVRPMEKSEVLNVSGGARGEQVVVLSRKPGSKPGQNSPELTILYERKSDTAEPRITIHQLRKK
ncbi:MAG: hypothetical protein VYE64_09990 [Planctomycetota bacterium]|nr:hypothetical protein [Planctomycetota bacterium]